MGGNLGFGGYQNFRAMNGSGINSITRTTINDGQGHIMSRTIIKTGGGSEPLFGPRRHGHDDHGRRSRCDHGPRRHDHGGYGHRPSFGGFGRYDNFRDYAGFGDFGGRGYYHNRTDGERFGDSMSSIGNGMGMFAMGLNFVKNLFNRNND